MATMEELIREILSDQKVQNEKIDVISTEVVNTRKDMREVRDSTIRFDEYRQQHEKQHCSHEKTHGWINKGLYAVVSLVLLGIIGGALKTFGVL